MAAANLRAVSRTLDDLPPTASDDELVAWGRQLLVPPKRPNRPLVAQRSGVTMTTEEVFADIAQRAAAVHSRKRLIVRR